MHTTIQFIRNFTFLTGLLLASALAMAQQDQCEKHDQYATATCNEAADRLQLARMKIANFASMSQQNGMHGAAVTQASTLRGEAQAFSIAFSMCKSAANRCKENCPQDSDYCKSADAKTIQLALQENEIEVALSKTVAIERATAATIDQKRSSLEESEGTQVAGGPTYRTCPGGSFVACIRQSIHKENCYALCPRIGSDF